MVIGNYKVRGLDSNGYRGVEYDIWRCIILGRDYTYGFKYVDIISFNGHL